MQGQEAPFVISVDGRWGTGKTFLLKRWRRQLEMDRYQAIYFNAWEDDYSDDPLLAIIGQLSEHFGPGTLHKIAGGVARAAGRILVHRATGVSVDELTPESLLDGYHKQRKTRTAVKERLTELGAKVREDTGQPLVFIIDELDRCRPTFAIELLERVKHIFDVDNIVFVFGINRGELVKSFQSVYGEIDADVYLRRFFDMGFVLPEPDGHLFCRRLALQFGLSEYIQRLSVSADGHGWLRDVRAIAGWLPEVLGNMGLSLRDLDYCVRLVSLAMRDFTGGHPHLFLLLVALKIKEPDLYQRFVEGRARGAKVIDYLDTQTPLGRRARGAEVIGYQDTRTLRETRIGLPPSITPGALLGQVEAAVYCADDAGIVEEQLQSLALKKKPARPEYLSQEHIRRAGEDSQYAVRLQGLLAECANDPHRSDVGLWSMAKTIDLYYRATRLPGI